MTVSIRRLEPLDDRTQFRSGDVDLDRFFIRYAGQNQFRHHIGTTYIATDDDHAIMGFVTVAAGELATANLPGSKRRALPTYPLPILRLARLAVDERFRGRGIGQALLRSVFILAHRMADDVGCRGLVVDAKPTAIAFYRKLGFIPLAANAGQLGDRPEPSPMFVELGAVPKSRDK